MIPQEQPQQVEEIGYAIVDRRRGHQQHAAAYDQTCQRTVAVGLRIAETVRFVDDDGRTAGRSAGRHNESFVGYDRTFVLPESSQQAPPLWHEDGGNDQSELLATGQGDRERDVR